MLAQPIGDSDIEGTSLKGTKQTYQTFQEQSGIA